MFRITQASKACLIPQQVRFFALAEQDPLNVQLDNLMKARPANKAGYINMPQLTFKKFVTKAQSAEDLETLKLAHVNFLGHRNIIPLKTLDGMMMRAIEIGHPSVMNEWFVNHEALIYHPSTKVIKAYLDHHLADYEGGLKPFFQATRKRYFLQRPDGFHEAIINAAVENGDKETAIDAYLDVLDYSTISNSAVENVMNCLSFEEAIDHEVFGHLKEQYENRSMDARLYAATYYFSRGDGYLTASDLITEVGNDTAAFIPESTLIKNELIAKLLPDSEVKMDSYVKDKLTTSVKLLSSRINNMFYDNFGELFAETPVEEAAAENIPEVDVEVNAEAVQEEAQQ